ncbi:hypothetical protein [Microcoleus sp. PH2017_40_RAT_O_B]|nr:hypothetical protein [Microcoleus sp. PH2017_40_RAT_O_B]
MFEGICKLFRATHRCDSGFLYGANSEASLSDVRGNLQIVSGDAPVR